MRNSLYDNIGSAVPIYRRSFTGNWIAAISTTAYAHVKCKDCGHEHLLAFPCKCRCFRLVIFNVFLSSVLRLVSLSMLNSADYQLKLIFNSCK